MMRKIGRRLFLLGVAGWPLAGQTPKWQGSWSASGGRGVMQGTWTASPGDTPQVLAGTWTIRDNGNHVVAAGTWSASKSSEGWQGFWRSLVRGPGSGGKDAGQLGGSWNAQPPLAADAGFATLLELAMKSVVSGGWSIGKRTGAWSIRVEPSQ
jgi:hypothetical protein